MLALVCSAAALFVLHALIQQLEVSLKRRRLIRKHGCRTPPSLPQMETLLGLDTLVESYRAINKHAYLSLSKTRFEQAGNTYQFVQLGSTIINTVEPENIKAILQTNFDDFSVGSRRQTAFEPFLGHGIFTADGSDWKESRKLLRPIFTKDNLGDLGALQRTVHGLLSKVRDDEAIDLQQYFFDMTIDFSTHFLLGESAASIGSPERAAEARKFGRAFDRAQRAATKFFVLGPLAIFAHDSQFRHDKDTIWSYINRYVTNPPSAPKIPESKFSFVNELLKVTRDTELIQGSLLNILLASRDTSASLLSNLWFVLASRPDIYARLQTEIQALDGRIPTREDLQSLVYMNACINESLRLHSPIPRNSRTAIRDTVLPIGGGDDGQSPILVAKGTQVGYQVFTMHRRKDVWGSDADDFVPERWIGGEKVELSSRWEWIPFNKGPRVCPGQQLALTEVRYITARLLQEFKSVRSANPLGTTGNVRSRPWREGLGLTCASADGTWVCLTRR